MHLYTLLLCLHYMHYLRKSSLRDAHALLHILAGPVFEEIYLSFLMELQATWCSDCKQDFCPLPRYLSLICPYFRTFLIKQTKFPDIHRRVNGLLLSVRCSPPPFFANLVCENGNVRFLITVAEVARSSDMSIICKTWHK